MANQRLLTFFYLYAKPQTMKTIIKTLLILFYIFGLYINQYAQELNSNKNIRIKKVWESPDLLSTSESVCYDSIRHILYVSCINGQPTDEDQNGFISAINLDGTIAMLNWIEGLNAPKGMAISGQFLFVTDINKVIKIDIDEAAIIQEFSIEGAQFLNDIAVDKSGNVFISDMLTSKIHIFQDGKIQNWLSDPLIQGTNGLFIKDNQLFIGTKSGIISANLSNKEFSLIVKNAGGIDGLKSYRKNMFLISDWAGKVQLVGDDEEAQVLLNTTENKINAADFEFIPDMNLIIIPTFFDNRIMGYEIIEGL